MSRTSGAIGFSATAADKWADGYALRPAPVFLFYGDSNSRGSAEDQASYSWTADAGIQSLGTGNAFAQYAPGTFTGLAADVANGAPGPEGEFLRLYRAANPKTTVYAVKTASAGSAASKLNSGTLTGSIAGATLTVTSGSAALGDLIYATGIGASTYIANGAGPYTLQQGTQQVVPYFADGDTSPSLSIASTTLSKANTYLSWKPDDGRTFYNAYRRLVAAFAALTQAGKRPYLAGVIVNLGANDASDATAASTFQSSMAAAYRSLKASPYWTERTIFVLIRVPTTGAGANVNAVRAASAAFKGQYRDVRLVDADSFAKNTADPIHYNAAGLVGVGAAAYGVWSGASTGL
jgi:hypothetical protein